MKQFFTSILLILIATTSRSQQIIWQENFEYFQGYQFDGWPAQINSNGAYPWETGYANPIGGLCFEAFGNPTRIAGLKDTYTCNQCPPGCPYTYPDASVMLVTPHISFSTVSGAWLSFDSYFLAKESNGKTESATVLVSADSGATWNEVLQVSATTTGAFQAQYADLAPYSNASSIQLGFRYSDSNQHMSGWMIDNVTIFTPAANDIALKGISPTDSLESYVLVNTGMDHVFQLFNNGLDPITSFNLYYKIGNGPVVQDIVTGVTIPPFQTLNYTHSVPDVLSGGGRYNVKAWATTPGDNYHVNDSASTIINGCYFYPRKRLTIEEGTGAWHMYAPMGHTLMSGASGNDVDLSLISCHDGDVMGMADYYDHLYYLGNYYAIFFLFDRRENVRPEHFTNALMKQQHYFGFADLDVSSSVSANNLNISIDITPAIDLQEQLHLALILTEDSVHSSDALYDQTNAYAGGALGPMGGYENMPNPVPAADMYYNRVARLAFPTAAGDAAGLPPALIHGVTYTNTFGVPLDPSWDFSKLHATVLLIRPSDSTILNSQIVPWPLAVKSVSNSGAWYAGIYPNPARDNATVFFEAKSDETYGWTLADISGRTLSVGSPRSYSSGRASLSLPVSGLANGVYFVTVYTEKEKKTMKLEVVR